MATRRLGIVVGGGPAPGINAVIGAATIQAINCGFEVVGFFDGFRHLCSDEFDPPTHTVRLEIARVARIHFEGGSILRTARTNLLDPAALKSGKRAQPHAEKVSLTLGRLRELGINYLLTIGGDDTALSARFISEAGGGRLRVVHVPKTIDNDLPLPQNQPTFGFSTARMIGAQLLKNLMMDSQTTGRWYLISAMGRSAGWLAMSIGQAAGATVTLIPEEFEERSSVQSIVDVLEGAILKRSVFGRCDGVAVIAEGLAYRLGDRAEIERLLGREVPLDAAGHMRLSEVPLLELLKRELQGRFKARGEALALITHNIGYELRSADPTPHDMAYCRALGYHSIRLFSDPSVNSTGVMVTLVNGNLTTVDFNDIINPETNRTQTRMVNISSDEYTVGRAYQIRLERSDLDNPVMLAKLAAAAHMAPADFHARYLRAATRLSDMQQEHLPPSP
ncbi:MAG: 6-phosphofructokinase [Phycisphaerae bacterium]|nr:6-phosphofructokinase [Phycisphaerae bacterium]